VTIVAAVVVMPNAALSQSLEEAVRLSQQAEQLEQQGRHTEAEPLYKRTLAIMEKGLSRARGDWFLLRNSKYIN